MYGPRTSWAYLAVVLLLAACESDDTVTGPSRFVPPPGAVAINFSIDDTANQTYTQSDGLAWKGSFNYDATTRILTRDPSWSGPFVLLWDDGPWSSGGHEPEGATANDHMWGVTVFYESPNSSENLEYGAIRGSVNGSDGDWIWQGANGTLTISAGQTDPVTATGLTVRPFGSTDLRLIIDTGNLDPVFNTFDPANGVAVKGSVWGWREITLMDDGTKGDQTASDGLFTFVLDEQTGAGTDHPHTGLMQSGDDAEFLFVLGNVEYKAGGIAATQGLTAATRVSPGLWSAATIELNPFTNISFVTAP